MPTPFGAITGMYPALSSVIIGSVLIPIIFPTKPKSSDDWCPSASVTCISCFSATTRFASFPESPMAFPPCWLIRETMPLLIEPASTISAISTVSASVTRNPCTNCDSFPTLSIHALIRGPPPCTTIGRMPTYFISTMSSITEWMSASSSIAAPPYLITICLS